MAAEALCLPHRTPTHFRRFDSAQSGALARGRRPRRRRGPRSRLCRGVYAPQGAVTRSQRSQCGLSACPRRLRDGSEAKSARCTGIVEPEHSQFRACGSDARIFRLRAGDDVHDACHCAEPLPAARASANQYVCFHLSASSTSSHRFTVKRPKRWMT
jgi:hypothetical protein